jgi:ribosomal protein S12
MFSATKLDICYTLIYQVHIMGYVPYVGWAISSHATVMIRLYVVKKNKKNGSSHSEYFVRL